MADGRENHGIRQIALSRKVETMKEAPYLSFERIKNHLAFYPDRVDAIEERPAT